MLLILTFWPNMPDTEVRVGKEWFRTDYLGHAVFYAVLIGLFLLWQHRGKGRTGRRFLVITAAAGLAFGLLTEATQHFIPGRSLNPFDLMYNCIGIISGILVYFFLIEFPRRKQKDVV